MADRTTDLVSRLDAMDATDTPLMANELMREASVEIDRLRTIVRSINRIISRNENYRWRIDRIVAALDGVTS